MAKVILENVGFQYPVYDMTGRSLKVSLMRQFSSRGGAMYVQGLTGVSLDLKPGDRLGLVGRNGAGKTTLLRMLAGTIFPTTGIRIVEGRVVPLIARGLGINPELSGYRNIELPMRLLGASTAEVKHALKEIPEWTGLGDFMHLPCRTYSQGMQARLTFAICTAVAADVLILDEWIGAGDAEFALKAQERINRMVSSTQIVVLASHSHALLSSLCNIVCWMDRGSPVMVGPADVVIQAYEESVRFKANRAAVA